MNIQEIASALMGRDRLETKTTESAAPSVVMGTATADSEDGIAYVNLGDDVIGVEDDDTTVEIPAVGNIEEGDDVIVVMTGPEGAQTPTAIAGIGGGDRIKVLVIAAQEAAELAEAAAAEAYDAVEAIGQNFFADSNGIHVTTTDGDANTGPNLLANSLGILLRDGTLLRTAQTSSGFAVYDGNGNQAANIVALLGDTSVIGKQGASRLVLSPETMELISNYGQGDSTVLVAGLAEVPVTGGTDFVRIFTFGDSFADSELAAAFGNAVVMNQYAFAAGEDVATIGYASQAFGEGTYGVGEAQFVCGMWNELDTNDKYLLIVGSGNDDNSRDNAFAVGRDNYAYADGFERFDGGIVPGEYELFASAGDGGAITLSDNIENYDRVRIYFKNTYGYQASTEAMVSSTSGASLCLTMSFAQSSTAVWTYSRPISISGTSLTNSTTYPPQCVRQTASGNTINTQTTSILSITRVVGIKE